MAQPWKIACSPPVLVDAVGSGVEEDDLDALAAEVVKRWPARATPLRSGRRLLWEVVDASHGDPERRTRD